MDAIGPSPATPQGRRSANYAVLLAKLEASCRVADPRCSPLIQPDLGRDATTSCHDPTAQRSGRRGSPVLSDSAASYVFPGGAAGPSASCASSAPTIRSPSPSCLSLASYAPHLSELFTGRVHASASQHVDSTISAAQRRPLSAPPSPPPLFEVRVHRRYRHRAERATHRHGHHPHAAPSAPPAEACAMATPHCARRRATLPERQPTPSTAEYYHRFLTAYRRSPAAAASSTLGLLRPCVVVASEAEDETLDGSVLVEGGGGSSAPPPPPVACLTTPCCSPIPTMGSDAEAVLDTSPSAPAEVACRLFSSISSSVNEGLH